MHLRNKVVFITGGASGIGAACAKAIVDKGAKVVIADNNTVQGQNFAESLNNEFGEGKAIFAKCDVSNEADFKDAFATAVTTFNQVDVMVNNAGIVDETNWSKCLDVNLKGIIIGTELALAHMRKDRGGEGGVIVNMSSMLGYYIEPLIPVYVASKHGIVGFTRSLANLPDIDKQGVRFACICPEMVDTPLFHEYNSTTCRAGYWEAAQVVISQEMLSPNAVAEGLLSLIADDDSNDTLLHVSLKDGLVRKKINVQDV